MRLGTYGRGTNGRVLRTPEFSVWFSYQTPIAFKVNGKRAVMRENDWGPTTGRHMSAVSEECGTVTVVSGADFENRIHSATGQTVDQIKEILS